MPQPQNNPTPQPQNNPTPQPQNNPQPPQGESSNSDDELPW